MGGLDGILFHAINRGPEWLAPLMDFLSEATNHVWVKIILLIMVIAMVWRGPRSRQAAIQALLAFPIANEITDLFKNGLPMPRPFQVEEVILRSGYSESMGTASAHSANMAAVACAFTCALGWRWGAPWIVIAAMTGISRIYNGVHYPYQVTLGWICGVTAGLVVCRSWAWIARRRSEVAEPEPDAPESGKHGL